MRQTFRQHENIQLIAQISCRVQPPGNSAPGSNAHIVFRVRTIYNPNPRHTLSPAPNKQNSAANTHRYSSRTSSPAPAPAAAPPHLPRLCCFFFFFFFCIAPRVKGVCFFSFFFVSRPGGPKCPIFFFFRKCPSIAVNVAGRLFYTCKIIAPRGAFTCIITVLGTTMAEKK